MITDLNTYLTKAIPDTKLTIKKYLNAKFEYLVRLIWLSSFTRFTSNLWLETWPPPACLLLEFTGVIRWQSYCLKVKEMDDEEHSYAALQEPLYRAETGNYEYRWAHPLLFQTSTPQLIVAHNLIGSHSLVLRCRQEARKQFAKLRADVLVKIELLDNKHGECFTPWCLSVWPQWSPSWMGFKVTQVVEL